MENKEKLVSWDWLSRADQILFKYGQVLKQLSEVKKEITEYIEKYDKPSNYDNFYWEYVSQDNELMKVYTWMYKERRECVIGEEDPRIPHDQYSVMDFYKQNEVITYKEIEWLHNLFIKKKQVKRKLWYAKWQITRYANKLIKTNQPITS